MTMLRRLPLVLLVGILLLLALCTALSLLFFILFPRLPVVPLVGILLLVALSTGLSFLFFILYLLLIVIGGAYLLTRIGLSDLEAGYALDRLSAHVGEELRGTYTLRNGSRLT